MLKKIRKFLENTSGSILPTMGILIIPLGIAAGAAVDYTRYANMRNEVQIGIDTAALATIQQLQFILPQIPNDLEGDEYDARVNEELEKYAKRFLEANITSKLGKESYVFNLDYDSNAAGGEALTITADIEYDTIFGGINGKDGGLLLFKDIISDKLTSIVNTGNLTIEVALVMDNSGSMGSRPSGGGERKINSMKTASTQLVDDLFRASGAGRLEDPVRISLVPFSGTVNVGQEGSPNLAGDFIDRRGFNPVHHENFDWMGTFQTNQTKEVVHGHSIKVGGVYQSRFDVFEMLGNTPWGGCVEMRPWPHNVLDTYVADNGSYSTINGTRFTTNDKDGVEIPGTNNTGTSALFVPYFAPDEPDTRFSRKRQKNKKDVRDPINGVNHDKDNDRYRNSYLYDFKDANDKQLYTHQNQNNFAYNIRGSGNQIQRTNWMFKYQRNLKVQEIETNQGYGSKLRTSDFDDRSGPNDGCTTQEITALSTNPDTIKDDIDSMGASGFTNIQQGLTWGWRTLSSGLPFDQGRASDIETNLKFIILLTDGNNFYEQDRRNNGQNETPNVSTYGAWGYTRPDGHYLRHAVSNQRTHNRMADGVTPADLAGTIYEGQTFDLTPDGQGEFRALMNVHTAQACENVKDDGISIYTIAYDLGGTVNDNPTKRLMDACSGSARVGGNEIARNTQFYFDADGESGTLTLAEAFKNISSSISAIRLAQ